MAKKNSLSINKNQKNESILKTVETGEKRSTKGFQMKSEYIVRWDLLVAKMKNGSPKRKGPELLDEAMEYLFDKYEV
jgi:hypothetical protein